MLWRVVLLLSAVVLMNCTTKRVREDSGPTGSSCAPCVASLDCGEEKCVQLEAESRCLRSCGSDSDCTGDERCVALKTAEGESDSACLADSCGAAPKEEQPDPCERYARPETANTCCKCTESNGTCAANNCFGGWVCDVQACRCMAPPSQCATPVVDAMKAGGAVTSSISAKTGGTANRLHFAIVGDTRPNYPDDTANYPTATINGIYSKIAKLDPVPSFAVATGDYVFASTSKDESSKQFDIYLSARSAFGGPLWPAVGNHECTGYTKSNCGIGGKDGLPRNYSAFISKMLGPISESQPWYSRRVTAEDDSWNAKLVVVAPNAWNETQATWLESELSKDTTYTFIVRHEPTFASEAPGVAPSDAIIAKHPVTLLLEGHSHTWRHDYGSKEVIIGNGGAPSTSSVPPGFTIISQRTTDNALIVSSYAIDGHALQTFVVKPDGTPAQ